MASIGRIVFLTAVFLATVPTATGGGFGVNVSVAPTTAIDLHTAKAADATWRVSAANTGSEPVSGRFRLVADDRFVARTTRTTVMPGTTTRTQLSATAPGMNATAHLSFVNESEVLAASRIPVSVAASTRINVSLRHAYPSHVRVRLVAPPGIKEVAITAQDEEGRQYVQRHVVLTNGAGYADVPYTPPMEDATMLTVSAATLDGRAAGATTAAVRRVPGWVAPIRRAVDLLEGMVVPRVWPLLHM